MMATMLRKALVLDPNRLFPASFLPAEPEVDRRLKAVVGAFAHGYNVALTGDLAPLPDVAPELRGFACEGAAMSACLLDLITLSGGRRLRGLLGEVGDRYVHLVLVGAGWAFARLRLRPWTGIRVGHPVLRWLAWDGWGFHQAFFRPQHVFVRHWVERGARGPARAIRDQGAGRALWFYAGADPDRIAAVIHGFPQERRSDLWAGVGLAASYTGAQPPACAARLIALAGNQRAHLAQGAAFAAKAHELSGVLPARSAPVIEVLTDAPPSAAAQWTDVSLAALAREHDSAATYEEWRAGIRQAWERQEVAS